MASTLGYDQISGIRTMVDQGLSPLEIAKQTGFKSETVYRHVRDYEAAKVQPAPDIAKLVEDLVKKQMANPNATPEKIETVVAPSLKFPKNPRSNIVDISDKRYERVAFLSDLHHPFQDSAAISVSLKVMRDYRPNLVILGGDYFDCFSISDHDREPGRADFLQDEFDAARETHKEIDEAAGDADIIFVDGNHEERINRIQRRTPGLFKLRSLELPKAAELPERWCYFGDQTRFRSGGLTFLHGNLRGRGTNSVHAAKGMLDKLRTSCMFGHLHRFQQFFQTGDDGTVRGGLANGHLCEVAEARYVSNPDWQSGFSMVDFDWHLQIFNVNPVMLIKKSTIWRSKTYAPENKLARAA